MTETERERKDRIDKFNAEWAAKEAEIARKKDWIKTILRQHDISMAVGGCGCCGSPSVRFEYNGTIVDEENFGFDTKAENEE